MKHIQHIIVCFFFFIASVYVHAQQQAGCYTPGRDAGIRIYNTAERMKSSNPDDAAQQYWAALREFQSTQRCPDKPLNHDLNTWESRCRNGIVACNWIPKKDGTGIERLILEVSLQTLEFDGASGVKDVVVTTNADNWTPVNRLSWCNVGRNGNRLSVTCAENSGTNIREGMISITANALTKVIIVTQAGKPAQPVEVKPVTEPDNDGLTEECVENPETGDSEEEMKRLQETVTYQHAEIVPEVTHVYDPVKSPVHYPPLYLAVTAGASSFGAYSIGEIKSGATAVFGLDIAYFFNKNFGAGLKMNYSNCNVDFSNGTFTYSDQLLLVGPALYGLWGKENFAFTASAGIGGLNWKMTNTSGASKKDQSNTAAGGFISAGFRYMFNRNFGIGLNVQSVIGSVQNEERETRTPAKLGVSPGLHFRF